MQRTFIKTVMECIITTDSFFLHLSLSTFWDEKWWHTARFAHFNVRIRSKWVYSFVLWDICEEINRIVCPFPQLQIVFLNVRAGILCHAYCMNTWRFFQTSTVQTWIPLKNFPSEQQFTATACDFLLSPIYGGNKSWMVSMEFVAGIWETWRPWHIRKPQYCSYVHDHNIVVTNMLVVVPSKAGVLSKK